MAIREALRRPFFGFKNSCTVAHQEKRRKGKEKGRILEVERFSLRFWMQVFTHSNKLMRFRLSCG